MSNSSQSKAHCLDAFPKLFTAIHPSIHRLNADILNIIFDIASNSFDSQAALIDLEFGPPDVITSPIWPLCHVCHSWRQIIFSNPLLWSNIHLHSPSHACSPLLLQQQLELAPSSLSIIINWSTASKAELQKLIPLFNMLCDKSHLWVDVALKLPSDFIDIFVVRRLPLPQLKRLQLSVGWYYCPILLTAEQAPKLRSFGLHIQCASGGLYLPWEQLKELKLRGSHFSLVLHLEKIDRLTSVEVFDVVDSQGQRIDKEKCKAHILSINPRFPSFENDW